MPTPKTIDEYIAQFPPEVQKVLKKIRKEIAALVSDGEEKISYGMPTFKLNGKNLVHFGGWKTHIGFYPIPTAVAKFQKELAPYKSGKGSIQFPLDKPIPYDLIKEIVKFRIDEVRDAK